ncbi:MCE family protein [Actinocorallia populi]|uniref:MCE family protein n=1 Tax=Actinocorallia populi TaxID=2079200 RepID=UPI000D097BCD|nr:MCE family protein [Actinocorallia populi]
MNNRVLVNLLVFAVLTAIVSTWAVFALLKVRLTDRPYPVTVEFAASPGLREGFDVAYLGVKVGTVRQVRLGDRKVVVELELDHDSRVPDTAGASARRKSAVGEPFVEFEPQPGDPGDGPYLKAGDVVPVERTEEPLSYSDLFGSSMELLKLLSPDDTRSLVHELAVGWNGRGESLAALIDGVDQLSSAFADNATELDATYRRLADITRVFARRRGQVGAGLDGLAATTATLKDLRKEIAALRDQAPDALARINDLLDAMPQADCLYSAIGSTLPTVFSDARARDLSRALAVAPDLTAVLQDVSSGAGTPEPSLRTNLVVTLLDPAPALEYKEPLKLPAVPEIPGCDGGTRETAPASEAGAQPPGSVPAAPPAVRPDSRAADTVRPAAERSPFRPENWLVHLPPILALLVLVRVAGGAVFVLARRVRDRRRP